MSQGKRVPAEIKEQILHRIRTEGISAAQAAKEHGISAPTIYTWLGKAVDVTANILQINKLRRENEELKRLLGQALLMQEQSKKISVVMDSENKSAMARKLGISRSSLYYQSKVKLQDALLRE